MSQETERADKAERELAEARREKETTAAVTQSMAERNAELLAERDAARRELAEAWAERRAFAEKVAADSKFWGGPALDGLAEMAARQQRIEHHVRCPTLRYEPGRCSCGLDDLDRALGKLEETT